MEAENQLCAEKHGDRQGQPPPADRPQYTPTPEQQQQQQQQQVTIVTANQAPTVYVQHVESYTGAIIYSCFTVWCFGSWIFGLIAFILAGAYATLNSIGL